MTILRDRLLERIAPLLEQARATLLRDGKPLAEPVPTPAGAVSTNPVRLPLAGVEAANLAARVEHTIRRYVAGLIGERDVALAVLEHPIMAARWPLSAGVTLPRMNEDYRPAYSDDEREESALTTIESAESARVDWPIDVAPLAVVSALRRVPSVIPGEGFDGRFDLDAQRVAWIVENGGKGWISSEGAIFVGDRKDVSDSFVSDGWGSLSVSVIDGETRVGVRPAKLTPHQTLSLRRHNLPADLFPDAVLGFDEVVMCVTRWEPVAVAVVLHVEHEVREWSSLYAVRRSLKRVRSLYGDKLAEHVSEALAREKADHAQALPALVAATRDSLRRFSESIGEDWPSTEAEAMAERDGVLEVDARFAELLEEYGAPGTADASLVREVGHERLAKYKARRTSPSPASPGLVIQTASWLLEPWESKRAVMLAAVLWRSEVKARVSRALEPVRMPTHAAEALAIARLHGGTRLAQAREILVEPPKGITLALPYDKGLRVSQRDGNVVGLRQVLTPRALRTYLATMLLYQDAGMREDGSFEIDGPGSILDVTGATKQEDRKGARTYMRYATKDTKSVTDDLRLFASVRVRSVGDLEALAGDPLLDEIRDRRNGKTVAYAHARLIVGKLREPVSQGGGYIRIPRAVCRLETDDVPYGMGIAAIARRGMLRILKDGGSVEAPIADWLEAASIDAIAQSRKLGRAFWPQIADKLARVAEEGKLGAMTVHGRERAMVLALDVEPTLRESYRPLLEASKVQESAKRAARVADKRKPRCQ